MRVLITGATGQLGFALQKTSDTFAENNALELIPLNRTQCDLSKPDTIASVLTGYMPDAIINAAAYTAVDKAESEVEIAKAVNADVVEIIANWCAQHQKILVHVSTDFVFDGKKSSPYNPDDVANPQGVYGKTKLLGEASALNCAKGYVVRTGWVYCEHGANFAKTIIRLAAEREQLGIVSDQIGTPTYAIHLAQMLWKLLALQPTQKIWHFSDAGVASWYDFAVAIVDEAVNNGLLNRKPIINPIAAKNYPTPAQRPTYSVLNKEQTWDELSIIPVHWRKALIDMLNAYQKSLP